MRELELEYALLLMVHQYCTYNDLMYHAFMSAGETAFHALGIDLSTTVEEVESRIDKLEEKLEQIRK